MRMVVEYRSHPFPMEPLRYLFAKAKRADQKVLALMFGPSKKRDMFNDPMFELCAVLVDNV